jgi:hypothetical protein
MQKQLSFKTYQKFLCVSVSRFFIQAEMSRQHKIKFQIFIEQAIDLLSPFVGDDKKVNVGRATKEDISLIYLTRNCLSLIKLTLTEAKWRNVCRYGEILKRIFELMKYETNESEEMRNMFCFTKIN